MTTNLENEATEVGRSHGKSHAIYVEAYGGDLNEVPSVPLTYLHAESFYLSGHEAGVAEYVGEQESADC